MVPVNLCLLAAWKNASWDRFVLLAQEVPTPCLPCLCVPNTLCSCWSLFLNQGVHLSPYTSEIADIRLLRTCVAHCTLQHTVIILGSFKFQSTETSCYRSALWPAFCGSHMALCVQESSHCLWEDHRLKKGEKGKGTVFEMLILWSRAALSQRFFTWALYMFILDLEELMSHLLEWGGVFQKQVASPFCWNTLSKCCKSRSASLLARSVIASVF